MGKPNRVTRAPASWRRYLRFWRTDLRADVDDELAFHLEMRKRDLEAHGLASPDASVAAERAFGDLSAIRDACVTIDERRYRRAGRTEVMTDMWNDIRFAARGLRKTPGFAAMAITCIALGIAATTTIVSAVNAILVRPLPYRDADRLLAIYSQNIPRGYHGTNISWNDYISWRDENKSLESVGLWTWTTKTLADGETERVAGAYVSANLFPTLGVAPLIGRNFVASEETVGQDNVVLISHGIWTRRFAGDPSVVGRSITMDSRPFVVVGVMPPNFNFPDRGDVWLPFAVTPAEELRGNRGYAGAIARLKPGVTLEQAAADLETISQRLQREYPNESTGWAAEPKTLREDLTGDLRTPLLVFLAAVGLVLLIACANVANLMLARGASRYREIAVRTALGAARGRLIRQLLTESMLIATIGGVAGALVGVYGVKLFRFAFPGDMPFYFTLATDLRALLVAAGVIVLTGILFGVLPALRTTRVDINGALRDGARGGEATSRAAMRNALVVAEVGLSVILMVGAMLLIRSYRAYITTDLGFEQQGILTARITLPRATYAAPAKRLAFFEQLHQRAASLPGVSVVGSSQGIPFSGWNVQSSLSVFGRPPARANEEIDSHLQYVFPTFFQSMGITLHRGRLLAGTDRDSLNPVAVVNEIFAKQIFPNEDPIGKRVRFATNNDKDPWLTIVGVIRDFRHYRLPQPMGPAVYMPYAISPAISQTLSIRTSAADPHSLTSSLRDIVRQIDPQIALYDVKTMDEAVNRSLWRQRLQGQVLGIFASLALVLAVVGIYGVISYTVAQRTRELGVRVALGAQRGHVLRLVLGHGARLTGVGIAVGLVGAFALKGTLSSLLYGVSATDLVSFVGVPVLLGLVTLLATYLPARRAMKVDPLIAIRTE